jgi:hypothetical protein
MSVLNFRMLSLAASLAACASLGLGAAGVQRESRERAIVVSVSTGNDAPVTDLTAPEFIVRENGVAREVIRVAPAPPPTHVMLLIDDSQATQASYPFLRDALPKLIGRLAELSPAPHIGFWTFGERPTKRADVSPNPEQAMTAVKRLFPVSGAGAYFLQGIEESAAALKKAGAVAPVYIAFVAEGGPEFSSQLRSQIATTLRSMGASLWVVTLQQSSTQPISAREARERAAVLGDVTVESGGWNKVILTPQTIPQAFDTVTALVTSRYLVTYGRPDSLIPPDKIEVTTKRGNIRVRASRWAGR